MDLNKEMNNEKNKVDNTFVEKNFNDILLQESLKNLYSKDKINFTTELDTKQINLFSKGLIFAERFNSKVLKNYINNIMELSISKGRKGRTEYINIIKSEDNRHSEIEQSNILTKLFQ